MNQQEKGLHFLRQWQTEHLPRLRNTVFPPSEYSELTVIIYCFPEEDHEPEAFQWIECAILQTWKCLGALNTIIVVNQRFPAVETFAARWKTVEIQTEPTLKPGSTWSMSIDCIEHLHERFSTKYCLVIQDDGFPVRKNLNDFFGKWDYVGAPIIRDTFRQLVTRPLRITALNGGFSLRSHKICVSAAKEWKKWGRYILHPGMRFFSEDVFYTVTAKFSPRYRFHHRFPTDNEAFRFAYDSLNGLITRQKGIDPFGFHGKTTALDILTNCVAEEQPFEASQTFISSVNSNIYPLYKENEVDSVVVVTVVRNRDMYERCIETNPFLGHCVLKKIDNSVDNLPIPVRYNEFLESYDLSKDSWFVFCHEDFEFKENPISAICPLDKSLIHGPIGAAAKTYLGLISICQFRGMIKSSDKSGQHVENFGRIVTPGILVDTLDCQCMIVHSSLLRKTGIRFDNKLEFDLYIEDFCLQALTRWNIKTAIVPLKCQHWSRSERPARFDEKQKYLTRKYPQRSYAGTVDYVGSPSRLQRINLLIKKIIRKILGIIKGGSGELEN